MGLGEVRSVAAARFSIGGVIAAGCAVTFRNFFRLLGIVAAIGAPTGGLILLVMRLAPWNDNPGAAEVIARSAAAVIFLVGYSAGLVAVTRATIQALNGEKVAIAASIQSSIRVLASASAAVLVYFILVSALMGGLIWGAQRLGADAAYFSTHPESFSWTPLAAGWVAMLGSVVLMAWIMTLIWVFVPVISMERAGPITGYRRSFALTKGRRWKVLGIVVLTGLILLGTFHLTRQIAAAGAQTFAEALSIGVKGLLEVLGVVVAAVGYDRLRLEKGGDPRVFD